MVLGLSLPAFTLLHVAISVLEIIAGVAVVIEMGANRRSILTGLFLGTALLTASTGFLFPFHGITPGIRLGVLSLVSMGVATLALYVFRLRGLWRLTYVIAATITLYFDVFVAVVQAFEKVPFLHALAPTQKELPFVATQIAVAVLFVLAGLRAARRFRTPAGAKAALAS